MTHDGSYLLVGIFTMSGIFYIGTILYKIAGLQRLSVLDVSPPTQGIPLICASTYVPVNYTVHTSSIYLGEL